MSGYRETYYLYVTQIACDASYKILTTCTGNTLKIPSKTMKHKKVIFRQINFCFATNLDNES